MSTLEIEILNPKAYRLLKDLADLELISIKDTTENSFIEVVKRIRKKVKNPPSLEEITAEVEQVRAKRYAG